MAATDETIASAQTMNASGLAARYAQALLSLADDARRDDAGAVDRIAGDLDKLFQLWRDDAGFRAFVADPRIDAASQRRAGFGVLDRAGIGKEVHNFLGVLIANRRLSALPEIAAAFGALLAARRGQQTADVTTAHPLTDVQRVAIAAQLTVAGYSGVRLVEHLDASLLGGLVVRIGSRLYDNSIKSKLQRLQYAMKGAA